ncbi:hypothetical protein [Burkholderia sp. Bp8998]|nr:hypothetical protein [Burkholderia sp. Bp8998]
MHSPVGSTGLQSAARLHHTDPAARAVRIETHRPEAATVVRVTAPT